MAGDGIARAQGRSVPGHSPARRPDKRARHGIAARIGLALVLALTLAGSPAFGQPAKAPEEKPEDYPDGPHRDDTFYFCTACHGFKIVAAQGLSREKWDETLTWMEGRHALPVTEGQDRAKLLDYLSTAFPQRQGPRGWKNPFQQ